MVWAGRDSDTMIPITTFFSLSNLFTVKLYSLYTVLLITAIQQKHYIYLISDIEF